MSIVFVLLALSNLATASQDCTDFSGKYMLQGEDGRVYITIKQKDCAEVSIERKSNYLEKKSSENHHLKLDGKWHRDNVWFGGSEKQQTAAEFVGKDLQIEAKRVSKKEERLWKSLYSLGANSDLLIKEFDEKSNTYGGELKASRQK